MINANELRKNNLITDAYYESFKTIIKVDSVNEKGINLEIEDDGNWSEIAQRWIEPEYTFEKLFPIPLTEEILLKCGFEKHIKLGGHDGYLLNGWFITTDLCFMVLGSSVILSKLKYLHRLQNIYFELNNEELKITL